MSPLHAVELCLQTRSRSSEKPLPSSIVWPGTTTCKVNLHLLRESVTDVSTFPGALYPCQRTIPDRFFPYTPPSLPPLLAPSMVLLLILTLAIQKPALQASIFSRPRQPAARCLYSPRTCNHLQHALCRRSLCKRSVLAVCPCPPRMLPPPSLPRHALCTFSLHAGFHAGP
jgi:hypothetical protein